MLYYTLSYLKRLCSITEGELLKTVLTKSFDLFKKYFFLLFLGLALALPELIMRSALPEKFFSQAFVPWVTFLFNLGWILLIAAFYVIVLPKRIGKILFSVSYVIFLALAFSENVYYKIFEQFYWLKSILLAGEGSEYFGYALQMIDAKLILLTLLSILFFVLTLIFWKRPDISVKKRYLALFLPVMILVFTHIGMQPTLHGDNTHQWDTWAKPRTVYRNFTDVNKGYEVTGLYQFTYLNVYTTLFPQLNYNEDDLVLADEYFTEKAESPANPYTNLFKGKNVIAVMMESMDTWTIDPENTPTLHKMMRDGIHFTNYNAPFFGAGFTFSSEFAFNTGFFTPASAGSASNFSTNAFPYAIARQFADAGYTCNSFHFNDAEFYNRGIMHKSFGYERYNALSDFGITGTEAELDSNLLSDEVYAKMTENTPFYNFVITYSAHLPYSGNSAKLALAKEYYPELMNEETPEELNNMQILAHDTDVFFAELLERLEADDLLNDTVIIAYTDHFAYGVSDADLLASLKEGELNYRVPAFIYTPNMRANKIDKPMMTIDWAPTIVNLFGLNKESRYLGNDVLDPNNGGFVYFENWGWMDEKMTYFPSEENQPAPEDLAHITAQSQRVKDSMKISEAVVLGDYYKQKK